MADDHAAWVERDAAHVWHGFTQMSCFADNAPSWRLMERVGMRREAYNVKDSLHRSGEWLDGMMYGLLADEWRAHERASSELP